VLVQKTHSKPQNAIKLQKPTRSGFWKSPGFSEPSNGQYRIRSIVLLLLLLLLKWTFI